MPRTRKKRSTSEGPMPAAGAGLIRFFSDSSEGVKVGPVVVLAISIALVVFVMLASYGFLRIFGF